MLSFSVVKSAGSAGNYYTDKDNYYVLGSMGERWAGQGAEQLGLQGSVDKDIFTRLLEGRLPDGADLSRMQDGSNKHRPGYDLTFSAPKSVSMMAMLGGDKRLIDAHNQAVDFAVRQVEALASTRVMTDGQSETVLTGNLVMALFNHDTSRDQDPQLHTHVVVANVTQHNGEWKTLSSDKVGKTGFSENVLANRIAFGKIYQSELRQRVEALGYEQAILTQAIRSELKTQGVLGHPEVTMTALSPVWLDSRSRYLRDMYRPGMVMEQWNPETRSHDRYVIDRVQAIAPGQPFRLQQTRSAADVAIMKEIVRQTPELREAVYSLINRDVERALDGDSGFW